MPAKSTEPGSAQEEAPAGPASPTGSKPAGSGWKAWLPLAATFLAMPLLAYLMTNFVLLPKLQKGLGIATDHAEVSGKGAKPNPDKKQASVVMNKLLVNVAGTMGARYLLVSLAVAGSDPDFKSKMQAHDPQLRDLACGALATKTLSDLEKPGARNEIRSELISGFNNILGAGLVQEIYLTEFAIQ